MLEPCLLQPYFHVAGCSWGEDSPSGFRRLPSLGHFMSQDFGIPLRSFGADSSSPQISAILVGHFTEENGSLRKSLQDFRKSRADKCQNPGSQNSLPVPRCLHTHLSLSIHIYIYMYLSLYIYIFLSIFPSLSLYIHTYMYTYIYIYVYMHIYICIKRERER